MRLLSRLCAKLAVDSLNVKKKYLPKKMKHIKAVDDYLKRSPTRANLAEIPSRFKNCLSFPPDSLICVDSIAAGKYIFFTAQTY